jgi:hypothetical protein
LAQNALISKPQISGWFSDSQQRAISRFHIARIAYALAGGYAGFADSGLGREHVELLFTELVNATRGEDSIRDALTRIREANRIVVGWVPVRAICDAVDDKSKEPCPNTFAFRLTETVLRSSGFGSIIWQRFRTYADLTNALLLGSIDLIAPILCILPARMLEFRFSAPVPGTGCRLEVIAEASKSLLQQRRTMLHVHVIKNEIGEMLATNLLPADQIASITAHDDAEVACSRLLSLQEASDDIHCFVADELTCLEQIERKCQLALLERGFDDSSTVLELPLAFTARQTDDRLIEVIDQNVEVLMKSAYARSGKPFISVLVEDLSRTVRNLRQHEHEVSQEAQEEVLVPA